MASSHSWRQNLKRGGGFWSDGRWYDAHVARHLPLVLPMLDELALALPPLSSGSAVCDLACGSGNAAFGVLETYPAAHIVLLDEDDELLAIAAEKISALTSSFETLQATVSTTGDPIPGAPYDVVVASLALHAIIGHDVERAEAESRYELLFQSIRDALVPGGHCIVGDHVGTLDLYSQLKAMERAGFTEVDCAWRQDDFFVAGGRVGE